MTSGITGASEGTKTASTASKVAEIADEAGNISRGEKVSSKIVEIGEEIGDTLKIKPPSKIAEPNKPPIEVPKAEKAPIEIPEITEKPKLPELENPIDKANDIAKEKPLYKEYIKPEDKKIVPEMGWDMPDGGAIINGREYSKHALERMAPDTPSVRAELTRRAVERAKYKGYVVGSDEYINEIIDYVKPRDIPPSVVENAILSTKPFMGNKPGTLIYITDDIKVVTDFSGKVITVMKQ